MVKKILCVAGLAFAFSNLWGAAKWISADDFSADAPNTWVAFRKDVKLDSVPKSVSVKIGADSKYWLWINGELAVFEGGLKRGPNPTDTYFDEIDIAKFLRSGDNKIALLLWYFGKDGFSHKSSGKSGMFFESETLPQLDSSAQWLSRVHPAFSTAGFPKPNYRLSESSIKFDANRDMDGWQTSDGFAKKFAFTKSRELGEVGCSPWNKVHKRPIPQWRQVAIHNLEFTTERALVENLGGAPVNIVRARLPYNMQMTPIITVDDPRGNSVCEIRTDNTYSAGDVNIRAEYVTKKGLQTYESLGWMNGHELILRLPRSAKVVEIKCRETGYDTVMAGKFSCDDKFYSAFWNKALRTLYVNMRDTFFDCPDRERAQWWGDTVILSGEGFYTYSPSMHALIRKAILQLAHWQSPDGALHAPIPGIYTAELPGQMLASIGEYGFWNYYMNTGDIDTIREVYPAVKKYLSLWTLDETGLTNYRKAGWNWGDWGKNRDMRLIFAGWHRLALEAAAKMADALGKPDDAKAYRQTAKKVREGFEKCWNGTAYRHPEYLDATDDRVQALAVLSDIADKSKYGKIFELFKRQQHASPYMEKYVMEALFKMGYGGFALDRAKKRFANMVDDPNYTTLFEGWEKDGFGGGSVNHAWSGGALTVIARNLMGLYPTSPAWKTFALEPDPVRFKRASIAVPSVAGEIKTSYVRDGGKFLLDLTVPNGTSATVKLPEFCAGKSITVDGAKIDAETADGKPVFELTAGDHSIIVSEK